MTKRTAAIRASIILIILSFIPSQLSADTIDDYIAEQMREKNIPGLMWNLELTEKNSLKLSDKMSMSGGWFVNNHPQYSGIGISGGTSNGYWRFLDEGLTIILLTNCQASDPNGIILVLAELYRRENDPQNFNKSPQKEIEQARLPEQQGQYFRL